MELRIVEQEQRTLGEPPELDNETRLFRASRSTPVTSGKWGAVLEDAAYTKYSHFRLAAKTTAFARDPYPGVRRQGSRDERDVSEGNELPEFYVVYGLYGGTEEASPAIDELWKEVTYVTALAQVREVANGRPVIDEWAEMRGAYLANRHAIAEANLKKALQALPADDPHYIKPDDVADRDKRISSALRAEHKRHTYLKLTAMDLFITRTPKVPGMPPKEKIPYAACPKCVDAIAVVTAMSATLGSASDAEPADSSESTSSTAAPAAATEDPSLVHQVMNVATIQGSEGPVTEYTCTCAYVTADRQVMQRHLAEKNFGRGSEGRPEIAENNERKASETPQEARTPTNAEGTESSNQPGNVSVAEALAMFTSGPAVVEPLDEHDEAACTSKSTHCGLCDHDHVGFSERDLDVQARANPSDPEDLWAHADGEREDLESWFQDEWDAGRHGFQSVRFLDAAGNENDQYVRCPCREGGGGS